MAIRVPRDAIVIRFKPTDPDRVLARAERDHRVSGRYALSVFADTQREGETPSDVIARLLVASELSTIQPHTNPKFYVCGRAGSLLDRGFHFVKDGYAGEVGEHYSVDLGDAPSIAVVKSFLEAFDDERRR